MRGEGAARTKYGALCDLPVVRRYAAVWGWAKAAELLLPSVKRWRDQRPPRR